MDDTIHNENGNVIITITVIINSTNSINIINIIPFFIIVVIMVIYDNSKCYVL